MSVAKYLKPGAMVPVNMETTTELVKEIRQLRHRLNAARALDCLPVPGSVELTMRAVIAGKLVTAGYTLHNVGREEFAGDSAAAIASRCRDLYGQIFQAEDSAP